MNFTIAKNNIEVPVFIKLKFWTKAYTFHIIYRNSNGRCYVFHIGDRVIYELRFRRAKVPLDSDHGMNMVSQKVARQDNVVWITSYMVA